MRSRMLTYAFCSLHTILLPAQKMLHTILLPAYQHMSAYVIRQNTSVYVSIRQHSAPCTPFCSPRKKKLHTILLPAQAHARFLSLSLSSQQLQCCSVTD